MFKTRTERLYERLLAEKDRQLAERDRLVDALAEQIEYLRMQIAFRGEGIQARPLEIKTPGFQLDAIPPDVEVANYVSDEELDAQALLEAGRISETELPAVLEALGMTPELEFESVG